jgi:hypothetical protein
MDQEYTVEQETEILRVYEQAVDVGIFSFTYMSILLFSERICNQYLAFKTRRAHFPNRIF